MVATDGFNGLWREPEYRRKEKLPVSDLDYSEWLKQMKFQTVTDEEGNKRSFFKQSDLDYIIEILRSLEKKDFHDAMWFFNRANIRCEIEAEIIEEVRGEQ